MQERAGGAQDDFAGVGGNLVERVEDLGGVGLPDVLAAEEPGHEQLVLGEALGGYEREGGAAFHEVEANGVEGEGGGGVVGVADVAKVGLQEHLERALLGEELGVEVLEERHVGGGLVVHQAGFVELDPLGAARLQLGEELGVGCEQGRFEGFSALRAGETGELEEGVGAGEDGTGLDAQGLGLGVEVERLGAGQTDGRAILNLRDEVVVVGVEPLLHRQRVHVASRPLVAAGHGEVGILLAQTKGLVARGDAVEEHGGVEEGVVEGEVVGGNEVQPRLHLPLPVLGAQALGRFGQHLAAHLPFEIALDSKLEFSLRANARVANDRRLHAGVSSFGAGQSR